HASKIGQIESFLYDLDAQDEQIGVAALLEHKRDDLVRAAVLQIHTAIEDLLTQIILYCTLGITKEEYKNRLRSDKARALRRMLYGGGSLWFRCEAQLCGWPRTNRRASTEEAHGVEHCEE